MPPIRKRGVSNPKEFVYEQAAKRLGCEVTDIKDVTIIRGGILRNIMTALENRIGSPVDPEILLEFRLNFNYTVEQCIKIVREALIATKKISV